MNIVIPRPADASVHGSRGPSTHQASARHAYVAVRKPANLSGKDCDDIANSLAILLVANLAARPAIDVASRIGAAGAPRRRHTPDCALDSTLLQVGNQLHVIVRLVDACTDIPILTRTFTGQTPTIRHVLAAIAWTVANDIEGSLECSTDAHERAS